MGQKIKPRPHEGSQYIRKFYLIELQIIFPPPHTSITGLTFPGHLFQGPRTETSRLSFTTLLAILKISKNIEFTDSINYLNMFFW